MSSSVFVPSETCREHDEAADHRGEVEHNKCGHGILLPSADYSWHRSRELIWVKSALDRAGYCRNYRPPDGRDGSFATYQRLSQLVGLAAFHAKPREGGAHPSHEGVELGQAQWARISRTPLGAIRVECQSRERRDPKRRTAYE